LQELAVVSLVGKQPMPNLIINLEYLPKEAFFLYTSDVHDVLGNLKEILKPKGIQCHSVLVPPFDYDANEQACREILAKASLKNVYFNVTGGTKVMSLAAFAVASHYGHQVIYLDTEGDSILTLSPTKAANPVTVRVDVETFLNAHGILIDRTGRALELMAREGLEKLVTDMGRRALSIGKLLGIIKNFYDRNDFITKITFRFDKDAVHKGNQRNLLDGFAGLNLIEDYRRVGGYSATFQLVDDTAIREFLCGDWIELYTYLQAKNSGVDDCLVSVYVKDERYEVPNEIDVLFTKDNHLGVCSCKTRREARIEGELFSEHIAAYETISRTLGGIFTKVFLISSEEIPEDSGTYQRAKSLQAEIVNPKQFPNLYQMLENIAWKSL
jgi:hypothetical protein